MGLRPTKDSATPSEPLAVRERSLACVFLDGCGSVSASPVTDNALATQLDVCRTLLGGVAKLLNCDSITPTAITTRQPITLYQRNAILVKK